MNRSSIAILALVLLAFSTPAWELMAQGSRPESAENRVQSNTIAMPTELSATTSAFSGGPAYDSDWVSLALYEAKTLTHNLGGSVDSYVVDMQYRSSSTDGINQRYYGGADFGASPAPGHSLDDRVGVYWRTLTTTSIVVYRRPEDTYAEQVRIRIWIDAAPNYSSGWTAINQDQTLALTHSLGGTVDDYVVDMQFKSSDVDGVNQRYYGGMDFGTNPTAGHAANDRVGAYWRSLTDTAITLYRRPEDTYAEQIRIRIWVRPKPTYDSGWVLLAQDQSKTLTHGIGGNPDDYCVDMQYHSAASGVNQRYYGGADFGTKTTVGNPDDRVGAYWRTLTSSSIVIYRRPEDTYADQVRIRIFRVWRPTAPDYDSLWFSIGQSESRTLTHGLGGTADDYLVDMQYKSAESGVNQRYYGGADFGTKTTVGNPDDRVGAYWRTLTTASIVVYRRPEDTYAERIRVRIWKMPEPDYDSGWVAFNLDQAQTLTHNLGGNYLDYLVDMQYKSADVNGVNQRYYGGMDYGANTSPVNARDGAYWRNLGNSSITVYRRPDDVHAPQIRIRIWRMAVPDFGSGWVALTPDIAQMLTHNLGGQSDNYLVNMIYWDTSAANYANQRHYGGADFGASPPSGYNADDRVGAYWRSLTGSRITVYRRPEDGFAGYIYLRIWITPYRLFLPVVLRN